MNNTGPRTPYNDATVSMMEIAEKYNNELEDAALETTNRAFNISCTIGLLPAGIIIGISFLLSRGSWIAAIITSLLMSVAVLGFASLAAGIARSNTIDRLFKEKISPAIDADLYEINLDRTQFSEIVLSEIPEAAIINQLLSSTTNGEPSYPEPSKNEPKL